MMKLTSNIICYMDLCKKEEHFLKSFDLFISKFKHMPSVWAYTAFKLQLFMYTIGLRSFMTAYRLICIYRFVHSYSRF